jgi:hypothetical protein
MALHTVHHWNDPAAGLGELRRVARRVVVVTGDAEVIDRLWLTAEYFPGIAFSTRREVQPQAIAERLGGRTEIKPLRVPVDCLDGIPEAFIARPEAYLDPQVRRNMSPFRLLPEIRWLPESLGSGVTRLGRLGRPVWRPAPGVPPGRGPSIVVSDPARTPVASPFTPQPPERNRPRERDAGRHPEADAHDVAATIAANPTGVTTDESESAAPERA